MRFLHFLWRRIGDVLGERPAVAKGVGDLPQPIAPEHIRQRHDRHRSRIDRALPGGIDIFHVDVERDQSGAEVIG